MVNENFSKHEFKILKTSYKRCRSEHLDSLKQEYNLIIRSVKMPQKEINSFADYAVAFKDLSIEKRTIYFCGIEIKLSKRQFAILFLLLKEKSISEYDYYELAESLGYKINKKALTSSYKAFISKFKNKINKCIDSAEDFLIEGNKNNIKMEINALLYYKQGLTEYILYTDYSPNNKMLSKI